MLIFSTSVLIAICTWLLIALQYTDKINPLYKDIVVIGGTEGQ